MKGILPWALVVIVVAFLFVRYGGLHNRIAIVALIVAVVAGVIVAIVLRK